MTHEQEVGCGVFLVMAFLVSHLVNTGLTNRKAATYEVEGDRLVFRWKENK